MVNELFNDESSLNKSEIHRAPVIQYIVSVDLMGLLRSSFFLLAVAIVAVHAASFRNVTSELLESRGMQRIYLTAKNKIGNPVNITAYRVPVDQAVSLAVDEEEINNLHKRQGGTALAYFYKDSNFGGGSPLTLYDNNPTLNDLSGYAFSNVISSLWLTSTAIAGWTITACTGTTFGGYCWDFATPNPVGNLNSYPNMNDQIKSIKAVQSAWWPLSGGGVTTYYDSNYNGRSAYETNTNWTPCPSIPSNGHGSFGSDQLSSAILAPATTAQFWRDTNGPWSSSPYMCYTNTDTANFLYVPSVTNNDWMSSEGVYHSNNPCY